MPVAAITSILHRISGVAIFFGIAVLLYLLDGSLSSAENFESVKQALDGFLLKSIVWLVLCGFIYHSLAGIRHLIMDLGFGESKEAGRASGLTVIALSIVLMLLAGVWLW